MWEGLTEAVGRTGSARVPGGSRSGQGLWLPTRCRASDSAGPATRSGAPDPPPQGRRGGLIPPWLPRETGEGPPRPEGQSWPVGGDGDGAGGRRGPGSSRRGAVD